MLDDLDRELTARGHRFVRSADDCNIYVRSERAGQRVMASVRSFVEGRLGLRVNERKSTVDRPWNYKLLGFGFYRRKDGTRVGVHKKTLRRFKDRVREITGRSKGWVIIGADGVIERVATVQRDVDRQGQFLVVCHQ